MAVVPTALSAGTGSGAASARDLVEVGDFDSPVYVDAPRSERGVIYVVEQGGRIVRVAGGRLTTFFDIRPRVLAGGEQGLLGLAFDPDFDDNGELYIAYTDNEEGDSILARYESPDDDGPFEPTGDPIVLAIPHDQDFHNGGDIMFGPDQLLYYSMGDGDMSQLAQNTSSLLGKVLRIDVLGAPAGGEKYNVLKEWKGKAKCPADGTLLAEPQKHESVGVAATLGAAGETPDSPVGSALLGASGSAPRSACGQTGGVLAALP